MTDTVTEIGGTLLLLPSASAPMSDSQAKQMRQAAYIEWLVLPRELRDPPTKRAVADLLGVTTATLLNYEKERSFKDEVQRRLGAAFRVDDLSDVFASLVTQAKDTSNPRSVAAAKVLVEWSERSSDLEGIDFSQYSDEEIEEARAAVVGA